MNNSIDSSLHGCSLLGRTLLVLFFLLGFSDLEAREPESTFDQVRSFPAAEAHQAAATTRKHVFAVTSRQVALYDRATGQRLAVSQGDALHLNSGLVWKRKLLCAHSNYPQQPEKSEIKVLDPVTMQLSTFHDFGDYGGSLTWVLRRQGRWLCNFARYGDVNAETFLVEFNDQFQELRRWTYPASVIEQLGRYSLSGGVLYKGHLLVTGHDDPIAFRLEIPRVGKQLVHLGAYAVPFTGQGFAVDPLGGGLIGISRARHEIIFARRHGSRERTSQ